jgi:hypothetical protein
MGTTDAWHLLPLAFLFQTTPGGIANCDINTKIPNHITAWACVFTVWHKSP